jgi:hypothetical protein
MSNFGEMSTDFDPADWGLKQFEARRDRGGWTGTWRYWDKSYSYWGLGAKMDVFIEAMVLFQIPYSKHYYIKKFNKLVKL